MDLKCFQVLKTFKAVVLCLVGKRGDAIIVTTYFSAGLPSMKIGSEVFSSFIILGLPFLPSHPDDLFVLSTLLNKEDYC